MRELAHQMESLQLLSPCEMSRRSCQTYKRRQDSSYWLLLTGAQPSLLRRIMLTFRLKELVWFCTRKDLWVLHKSQAELQQNACDVDDCGAGGLHGAVPEQSQKRLGLLDRAGGRSWHRNQRISLLYGGAACPHACAGAPPSMDSSICWQRILRFLGILGAHGCWLTCDSLASLAG